MREYELFEQWEWNPETCYKEVTFSLPGHPEKEFICLVKVLKNKKNWIILYQNEDNPDDFWVRKELVSQPLWFYGKEINQITFDTLLNKLVDAAKSFH